MRTREPACHLPKDQCFSTVWSIGGFVRSFSRELARPGDVHASAVFSRSSVERGSECEPACVGLPPGS